MSNGQLTQTEAYLMHILDDGEWHERPELMACLGDELTGTGTLRQHLCNLRKKIEPLGFGIESKRSGYRETQRGHYRKVRLTASPNDGRR